MAQEINSEPNVVPLCDILLVLLIFFMVITPVAQKGIDVKLPETRDPGPGGDVKGIVLTLEHDMSIKINALQVNRDMLESELRNIFQTRTDKTIFIRADESIKYGEVLKL